MASRGHERDHCLRYAPKHSRNRLGPRPPNPGWTGQRQDHQQSGIMGDAETHNPRQPYLKQPPSGIDEPLSQLGEHMKQQQRARTQTFRHLAFRSLTTAALALAIVPVLIAQMPVTSVETLRKDFLNPPNEARPMVRWWWFGPAVVKPEILRELQQMKADGIQGAELAFVYPEVLDDPAKVLKNFSFLSPEMLDAVNYAQSEGRKLGLRIDVTLCSGWPYGGPHITLAEAVGRFRPPEVPVAANATTVQVPALQEGESIISASIASPAAAAPLVAATGRGRNAGPRPASYDPSTAKPLTVSGGTASITASDKPRVAIFFISSHTTQ